MKRKYKKKKEECPAIIEGGVCFAGNLDPSCQECKRQYKERKNKESKP